MMEAFPPNPQAGPARPGPLKQQPPKVERVITGSAKQKKTSLGSRFKGTFIGGDARTAADYVVESVIVPAIRDTIFEAGSSIIERIIYGGNRPKRGPQPLAGPLGYVAYNRTGPGQQRAATPPTLSAQSRARHAYHEIVLENRVDAEEVLDQMYNILEQYDVVTVANLYALTGLQSAHTDNKWGWTQLRSADVGRVRGGGYSLELPEPQPLE